MEEEDGLVIPMVAMIEFNTHGQILRKCVPLSERQPPVVRLLAQWKFEIRGGQQHFPSFRDGGRQTYRSPCPDAVMFFVGPTVGRFDFGESKEDFTADEPRLDRSPHTTVENPRAAIGAGVVPNTLH